MRSRTDFIGSGGPLRTFPAARRYGRPSVSIPRVRFSNRPFRVKRFQTIHDCGVNVARGLALLFSNRPFRVKRFQTIHDCGVNVARGLALLSGLGTKALPSRVSKTRTNNLSGDLAVNVTAASSGRTNSPR